MKIIYYCHTGAHTALVAAAVHLGILPFDRTVSSKQLCALPFYNKIKIKQLGTPLYIGQDVQGNHVYSLGVGYEPEIPETAIKSFMETMNIPNNYLLVSTLPAVNRYILTGSFISVTGMRWLGQQLTTFGIRKNYNNITDIVVKSMQKLSKSREIQLSKVIPFPLDRVNRISRI